MKDTCVTLDIWTRYGLSFMVHTNLKKQMFNSHEEKIIMDHSLITGQT